MPFFSIIIPVFNASQTIQNCLASMENQTFTDYEIIIVDGLSSDDTLLKISQSSQHLSNLKVLSEKDEGIYDAMNKGIAASQGRYLYFLGSDDTLYSPTVLETIYSSIQKENNPDLIYGNVLLGDTDFVHNGEYDLTRLFYLNICHQSIFYSQ